MRTPEEILRESLELAIYVQKRQVDYNGFLLDLEDVAEGLSRAAGPTVVSTNPRHHVLKTWPEYFNAIGERRKTFEARKNDRGFEVGDSLELQEWNGVDYTGRWIWCRVTYVMQGGSFGVEKGHCILGIALPANHIWPISIIKVPQYNTKEASGAECPACEIEQLRQDRDHLDEQHRALLQVKNGLHANNEHLVKRVKELEGALALCDRINPKEDERIRKALNPTPTP
jgi:hypothetical protein